MAGNLRDLIRAANEIVATDDGTIPGAKANRSVGQFAVLGSAESVRDARVDVKAKFRELTDWGVDAGVDVKAKFTKKVMKPHVQGMLEGQYSQAVEMASFISACAPHLESDRLARIAERLFDTKTAYAPIRSVAALSGLIGQALGRFAEARREELLASLWTVAHDGLWWEETTGRPTEERRRRRRRRNGEDDVDGNDLVVQLLAAGPIDPHTLIDALETHSLMWHPQVAEKLTTTQITGHHRGALARIATADRTDSEQKVLLAHLASLRPDERPESPIPAMLRSLVHSLDTLAETAADELEELLHNAKEWGDLYPEASGERYNVHRGVLALRNHPLPSYEAGLVTAITNDVALRANADAMRNCTWSYQNRLMRGSDVLLHITDGADPYNVLLTWNRDHWQVGTGGHFVGFANSQNVPDHIRAGVRQLATELPAAMPEGMIRDF